MNVGRYGYGLPRAQVGFKYAADPAEFRRRSERMKALLGGLQPGVRINAQDLTGEISSLLNELPPFPLQVGANYRVSCLAGPEERQRRLGFEDDEGNRVIFSIPEVEEEFMELTGVFLGRRDPPPGQNSGMMVFQTPDGVSWGCMEMDVLRMEEV